MKSFFKFFMTIIVCISLMVFLTTDTYANGTAGGTLITAGFDASVANTADTFGDLVVQYQAVSGGANIYATPASAANVNVSNIFGNQFSDTYLSTIVVSGDTAWYSLTITNKGNASDTIFFDSSSFNFLGALGADSIQVSFWNAAQTAKITNTSMLAAEASEVVYVAVYFANGLNNGDSMNFIVRAIANNGLGGDTGGYIGANSTGYAGDGDDTILLSAEISSAIPAIYVSKSVQVDNTGLVGFDGDTANVVPGSVLLYSIRYDNDGDGSGYNVAIIAYIPENTDLDTATAAMTMPDTNNVGSVVIEFSNDGSTWSTSAPANVNRIRWTLTNPVLANNNSEGTDTVGVVDGDIQDADSGRFQYRVIVK